MSDHRAGVSAGTNIPNPEGCDRGDPIEN